MFSSLRGFIVIKGKLLLVPIREAKFGLPDIIQTD
jgi:hypothetical protein